jgi:tetratricopeptide (TPR) repeat protein
VHLAVALRATKRFDEAEAELRRAIDADKQSWTARHELGVTLLAKGAPRDAVEPLRDAVRMNPDSAVARDDHGRAYLAADRADEALAEFRKAVELDASLTVAHRHLGELLLARCDFAGAKDELDSWKTDEPDDPACRRALAQALLGVGEVDAATTEFRAALHLDPDDPGTLLLLHGQLELTGACDDALAVVAETAKWNPKSPQILACHGFALMQRGRLDEALTQLRAAQGGGATTPGSWPRAADAAQWLARAERLAAADRDPNSVTDAQDRLGLAQWNASRGMFDAAVNLYRAAFAASPKLADDVAAGHRAAAARAALGAVAQAKPPAAATMRKSALEWLRADLAPLRAGLGGKDARTAADARAHLAAWRVDPRFASVRDDAESSKLPASEADEWRTFWRDVEVALASPVAN